MKRQNDLLSAVDRLALRRVFVFTVAMAVCCTTHSAWAQGLNYVDGDDFLPNLSPLSAINSASAVGDDNLWGFRAFGSNNTLFESAVGAEDSPELTQTLTSLAPNTSYDLYAVYWTDKDENWAIQAGVTSGSLTPYSFTGEKGASPTPGTMKGITAGASIWDTLPAPTSEGTVFTQRPADPLVMLLAPAGTATSDGSGQLEVFVDDMAAAGGARRTWFDGVAYVDAGTSIALTATIDRMTGELTVANPTDRDFQIKSITLDSPAGALNEPEWTPISGRLDGSPTGDGSFDSDVWNIIPSTAEPPIPTSIQLVEAEDAAGGGSGGTLAANGGSLSLGNIWTTDTPFEDIRLSLTLTDDTLAMISPQYVNGTGFAVGDFNASGTAFGLDDFEIMLENMHTNITAMTGVERHQLGDITGNGLINFNDYVAFRDAYDAVAGAGAFNRMIGQVPEPTSAALLLVMGGLISVIARCRSVGYGFALAVCCLLVAPADAQPLLMVDVDARAGTANSEVDPPVPLGDNTVPGFGSFALTPETTAQLGSVTAEVNGYTVTVSSRDPEGNLIPDGLADRDRATPTTAPTLNQLYDDFIFANFSQVGLTGGLDLQVGGGALEPSKSYILSIYSFDTSSTGLRTANWTDGNSDLPMLTTSFDGTTSPALDDTYKFSGVARTDESGNIFVRGRSTTATTHGVFLNGFEIEELIALTLEVNTTTGATRLVNEFSESFDMSYYEIRSGSGALDEVAWTSLSDAENIPTDDPIGTGWDEVPTSNPNLLSELMLESMTTFDEDDEASLGSAFSVGGAQDIQFLYAAPGETTLQSGIVKYVSTPGIVGDYNQNGVVDAADYTVWRDNLGTNNPLPNEDATPGEVTAEDYAVWKQNFGQSSLGAGAAVGTTAVPEPTTLALLLIAVSASGLVRWRAD